MVTNFTIDTDGNFKGNGVIPYLLNESDEPITIVSVFNEMLKDVRRLHDVYILTMSDDGKITGRERFQICRELDNLLGDLILLRVLVSGNRNFFDLMLGINNEFVTFRILKQRWESEGNLGSVKKLNFTKFQVWLTKYFSVRLSRFVTFMQPKLKLMNLEEVDKIQMHSYLDKIILSTIISRNDIFSTRIS
ncbi:MAG: hypothetical protein MH321_00300 [Leptospiraceae bacterium]|nr:hypothetical protein [Leptospiraceae bacterium]